MDKEKSRQGCRRYKGESEGTIHSATLRTGVSCRYAKKGEEHSQEWLCHEKPEKGRTKVRILQKQRIGPVTRDKVAVGRDGDLSGV
jgi:hypothetical protein